MSSLSFEVLKGLVDKLIPSHPSVVVEVIAPSPEMITQACEANEDLYFLLVFHGVHAVCYKGDWKV